MRPDEHDALGELPSPPTRHIEPAAPSSRLRGELRDVAGRSAGAEVLVAVDGGRRCSAAVTYVPGPASPAAEFTEPDAAGIRMLAVAPDAQRRGVGEALTRACVDRARASRARPGRSCTRPTGWRPPTGSTCAWASSAIPGSTGSPSPGCGSGASACRSTVTDRQRSTRRAAERSGRATRSGVPGRAAIDRHDGATGTPRPSSTAAPAARPPGARHEQLGPPDAAAHHHRPACGHGGVDQHRPAGGRPIGVMPPYSMPVAATARSMAANDALRASSVRRRQAVDVGPGGGEHDARRPVRVSPDRLAASTTQLAELVERHAVGGAEGRGVGQVGVDRGDRHARRRRWSRPPRRGAAPRPRGRRAGRAGRVRGPRRASGRRWRCRKCARFTAAHGVRLETARARRTDGVAADRAGGCSGPGGGCGWPTPTHGSAPARRLRPLPAGHRQRRHGRQRHRRRRRHLGRAAGGHRRPPAAPLARVARPGDVVRRPRRPLGRAPAVDGGRARRPGRGGHPVGARSTVATRPRRGSASASSTPTARRPRAAACRPAVAGRSPGRRRGRALAAAGRRHRPARPRQQRGVLGRHRGADRAGHRLRPRACWADPTGR